VPHSLVLMSVMSLQRVGAVEARVDGGADG
jgi:hypothetical protein